MAEGEIVLARSIRGHVEKLDFDRPGAGWRVVMERPGAKDRSRPPETVKRYADADEAWKDIANYVSEGFKIVLYQE